MCKDLWHTTGTICCLFGIGDYFLILQYALPGLLKVPGMSGKPG